MLLITACSGDEQKVHLRFDDVSGLEKQSPVFVRGYKVGMVTSFTLLRNGVVVSIELAPDVQIPSDSKFKIVSRGILGGKAIEILPGKAETSISKGDTLTGLSQRPVSARDSSGTSTFQEFLKTLVKEEKKDSILQELKKLNRKLDRQKGH